MQTLKNFRRNSEVSDAELFKNFLKWLITAFSSTGITKITFLSISKKVFMQVKNSLTCSEVHLSILSITITSLQKPCSPLSPLMYLNKVLKQFDLFNALSHISLKHSSNCSGANI